MTANLQHRLRTSLWRGETAPIPVVRTPTRGVYPRRRPEMSGTITGVDHSVASALRVGTVLLSGGAPTEDVEAAVFAVGTALGLEAFEVEITYHSIVMSVARTSAQPAITDMRVVRARSTHYAQLAAMHQLVMDLVDQRIDPSDLDTRLAEIESLRRPYPRWFAITAFAALSSAITVQLGGNSSTAAIALAAAFITGSMGHRFAHRRVPAFFINLVLAFTSTLIAVGVTALDDATSLDVNAKGSLLIVGGIVALLPGMALMVASQEAISTFSVTAAGRLVEVTYSTIGIVSGVLLGLVAGNEFHADIPRTVHATVAPGPMTAARIATVVSAAAVASAAAAISYQSPRRLVVLGAALGAFGFALMVLVDPIVESIGVATAVPAFGIGMAARLTGVRVQVPTVLITVPAIIPLLPGLAVFQGLLALVQNDPLKGIAALVQAASISIALAAGVLLGQFIGGRLTHRPGFTGTFLREGFGIHSRS